MRQDLRKRLKRQRAGLRRLERERADQAIVRHLLGWSAFRNAKRVASYYSVASEVSTRTLNTWLVNSQQSLFLPCLPVARPGRLLFCEITSQTRWSLGQYQIPEPLPSARSAPRINPAFLDIILVPLVGFDAHGNRMGMGAGYYDRSLAFRRYRRIWRKPLLVGLAYACQQVDKLPAQAWDVPLDLVITEQAIIKCVPSL
ncbi:MAG: 5-formyltetrahydrofolate cyclo-ligase [Nevskiales bacterium]